MEKQKYVYEVYVDRATHSYLGTSWKTSKLGETWAVSAAKAINNIKFRLRIKNQADNPYQPSVTEKYYAIRK